MTLEDIKALVERQALAWERNDFALAAGDWRTDGELVSPAGHWRTDELPEAMAQFHRAYQDLEVRILNVFANPQGTQVAIEWDWICTRRSDGLRGITHDAIIADLIDGQIQSWREYFDLGSSLEGS